MPSQSLSQASVVVAICGGSALALISMIMRTHRRKTASLLSSMLEPWRAIEFGNFFDEANLIWPHGGEDQMISVRHILSSEADTSWSGEYVKTFRKESGPPQELAAGKI